MDPIKTNEELSTQISPILSPITIRSKQMTPLLTFDWGPSPKRSLLLVCKLCNSVIDALFDFARHLLLEPSEACRQMVWHIHVEETLSQHPRYLQLKEEVETSAPPTLSKLCIWPLSKESMSADSKLPHIDLIVSLGGDGTVLHSAWLFQGSRVPPILPVYVHGSLGFLTVFDLKTCYEFIDSVACGPDDMMASPALFLNHRMRLRCTIVRSLHYQKSISTHEKLIPRVELGSLLPLDLDAVSLLAEQRNRSDKSLLADTFVSTESFHVLNELVVDRGPSPFMTILELYGDDRHLTTVQADGLVIATPTGSTAYSMSAGGSIVDPSVPAILVTPICAHTLSFRPLHLRDNIEIKVLVPLDARHTAWASFDGRHRVELQRGDYIIISVSNYPVPTLGSKDQTLEWFESLQKCLQWNERRRQE